MTACLREQLLQKLHLRIVQHPLQVLELSVLTNGGIENVDSVSIIL